MSLTKRQHYVPRVYLRAWVNDTGTVNVLDKETGNEIFPTVENICLEKYYYEDPQSPPTNELEDKFGEYEGGFGKTRDFLSVIESSAKKLGQPIAETLVSALVAMPKHVIALKNFAGTAYFRTPAAMAAIRQNLESDSSPEAKIALEQINSPYALNTMAFESTLLERFMNLDIALMYSSQRLHTSDWACFPVFGGNDHKNFVYDIGRHKAATAVMPLTPSLAVMFLPNIENRKSVVISKNMPTSLANEMNQVVYTSAGRWVIK